MRQFAMRSSNPGETVVWSAGPDQRTVAREDLWKHRVRDSLDAAECAPARFFNNLVAPLVLRAGGAGGIALRRVGVSHRRVVAYRHSNPRNDVSCIA